MNKFCQHIVSFFFAARYCWLLLASLSVFTSQAQLPQAGKQASLEQLFQSPPPAASPWVFWYWNQASVSQAGITADLESMKQVGIGGAYLMFIKGVSNPPLMEPPVEQLSPLWWKMVRFALTEAKRLHLQIGIHFSDGFALGGGPWITPELSMQKMVWSSTQIKGGMNFNDTLAQPPTNENYYKDVAVFAYPSPAGSGSSTKTIHPRISSNKPDSALQLLTVPGNKKNFTSNDNCWIQYEFERPFTCRTIVIHSVNNYQSNRLQVAVSNDGINFTPHTRLEPPRHGWQDWDAAYTHAIPAVTAKYFRFIFDKTNSEPGAEDLDAAKWKPTLRVAGIELSSEARIDQFEGKNGEVWRISENKANAPASPKDFIPLNKIINLSSRLDANGRLQWKAPPGNWTILRMGHTSTGHRNATGGGGKGLECDKFNPVATRLQFAKWFGAVFDSIPPKVTDSVLTTFHLDSWECGSQNWSPVFREAFRRRRGYDLFNYLPAIAGIPVENAQVSETFLQDVKATISELINDNFYKTLRDLAHNKGCSFTAESVAPTMVSDGMLHYQHADVPMGEFWLRSPTHDKPNDMLDAISAAHIYGKNIIQAEAFTELRMLWDEHPGMLKTLQDRNYALGINRLSYHVFMHNPWMDRKPGMTLDGIGLYFQRDQTWWKQGRAWVDYARRCQALLQVGVPVTDIAVFTGEDFPRRSILPDRLVKTLPGIFGEERVQQEAQRLLNVGEPMKQSPPGVNHSANITEAGNWVDPLNGYAYDSYNKDAMLRLTSIKNKRLIVGGSNGYQLLVVPGKSKMNPGANYLSGEVLMKLNAFVEQGATLILEEKPTYKPGMNSSPAQDKAMQALATRLWDRAKGNDGTTIKQISPGNKAGAGVVLRGPYAAANFDGLGITRDVMAMDAGNKKSTGLDWTHRAAPGVDIYFIANQLDSFRVVDLSLRVAGRVPELWDAVTGQIRTAPSWKIEAGRTNCQLSLPANGSMFVVFQQPTNGKTVSEPIHKKTSSITQYINTPWAVQFDTAMHGYPNPIVFDSLQDWSRHPEPLVKYFSGTATYSNQFEMKGSLEAGSSSWLELGEVANIAEVFVNGINCGIVWTAPFRVDIGKALRRGMNELRIEVTNTWANRIVGDQQLPAEKSVTQTNSPYRLNSGSLLKAGLLGPVVVETTHE
ncbi:MAG: glycosyl hydrolase [Bacteroidota bacterium]